MSREFGNYDGGAYMHTHVQNAGDDCRELGRGEVTKLLGEILNALYPVAYAVSSHEAGDAGPDAPLFAAIEALPFIDRAAKELRDHVEPYRRVAARAVREAVDR